jgi:FMN phosphatase YigB (HAD superfamily)
MSPSTGNFHDQAKKVNPTLLFDLDDTLLGNNMDMFLPAYLRALSACMASYSDPGGLIKTLMDASGKMIANLRPDRTLEEVFDAGFYPPLGIDKEQVRGILETFYRVEFPKLRSLTQYKPEAVELVKASLSRGYRVAIATNSLFPSTAITQRLSWAGLSPDQYPMALIPSFQTFHYAKPNPAYFSELMAKMAWPEGPVVMAGDSFSNDINPARQAGLSTFWVDSPDGSLPEDQFIPNGRGSLLEFLPWLDSIDPDTLLPDFTTISAVLATLRSTPAFLHSISADLTPEEWLYRPAVGEWSVLEILCHLADMDAEVNLPRLRKVLNETNPFVAGLDTDAWAVARQYIRRDPKQSLRNFVSARLELIAFLEGLSPVDWQRQARHAIFGPTSLHEMAIFAAGHDRLHVRQIHQTISTYEPV